MGRIAGLLKSPLIQPLVFSALTYGIGRLSGQDNQRALLNTVGGVGGAYAGEVLAHRYGPHISVNPTIKGRRIPINLGSISGSIAGGYIGTGISEGIDRVARGNEGDGGEANPFLLAADELAMPVFHIARALS